MADQLLAPGVRPSPVELYRVSDALTGTRTLRDGIRYHRVRAGIYAPRAGWDSLAPWDRYLARVHAYALVNPGALFAYESAAALWGLPIFGEPRCIHVYELSRTKSRRFGDVFVHTRTDDPDTVTLGGLTMTSVSDTAVSLMRVLPAPFGLAVGDAAISPAQGAAATLEDLVRAAAAQPNPRGRALLNLVLDTIDPRSESPGESVGRGVIVWSGFEPPELQREFRSEGFVDRADYAWESVHAIAESDGYGKYLAETPEETVRRVILEKQREDRLRRLCLGFGRWDMAASTAVAPVINELQRMAIPRVGAPRAFLLSTMRSNPRSFPGPGPGGKHRRRAETPSKT